MVRDRASIQTRELTVTTMGLSLSLIFIIGEGGRREEGITSTACV